MRKEKECGMLRFSKKMSRDVLHSQSVHFTTVILKYYIKKKPPIPAEKRTCPKIHV